jgi:hypothetical protein
MITFLTSNLYKEGAALSHTFCCCCSTQRAHTLRTPKHEGHCRYGRRCDRRAPSTTTHRNRTTQSVVDMARQPPHHQSVPRGSRADARALCDRSEKSRDPRSRAWTKVHSRCVSMKFLLFVASSFCRPTSLEGRHLVDERTRDDGRSKNFMRSEPS